MMTNPSKLKPKKLVFDYYDSLINKIDIYTEQLLEKFTSTDTIEFRARETTKRDVVYFQKRKESYGIESYNDPYPYQDYKSSDFQITKITRFNYRLLQTYDYLNSTRDQMIEKLREIQTETLRKLDEIKHEVAKINDDEEIHEKLFSLVFAERFPILLEIKKFNGNNGHRNSIPFKLFLLELDFYIHKSQAIVLK